jgi:hypothetical protein
VPNTYWESLSAAELIRLYIASAALVKAGLTSIPRIELLPGHAGQGPLVVMCRAWYRLKSFYGTSFDGPAVIRPLSEEA